MKFEKSTLLVESPVPCDLKVGDPVSYTNPMGVVFTGHKVIGFSNPENNRGRFIHVDHDAPWFPAKAKQIQLESRI